MICVSNAIITVILALKSKKYVRYIIGLECCLYFQEFVQS